MKRRQFLLAVLATPLGAVPSAHAVADTITVYKSPTWGCCGSWIDHLRANGFRVKLQDVRDTGVYRARFGIPPVFASCHTAVIGGYAIEGHVPPREIRRLLGEQPKARGLAVPGMPGGSPGMEGNRSVPYEVFLVLADGSHRVYSRYGR